MVSHIVNLWSIIVFVLAIIACAVANDINSLRIHEICQSYTGRRIYLESNERGFIQASNISNAYYKNKIAKIDRLTNSTANFHYRCQLELVTCSACVFQITITDTNLTVPCTISDVDCECVNYISFSEPPYESAERKWCGKLPYSFRSRSRVLVITYVYQLREYNIFNLTYTTERNVHIYDGYVSNNKSIQEATFQSPFFPNFYPHDLVIEYLIRCNSTADIECITEITFTDFQISSSSVIEFYDENEQLLAKYNGDIFRPPIVRSTTSMIVAKFHANGGTGFGYNAGITYLSQMQANQSTNTHCGGLVGSFGGAITMMNMTNSTAKVFDCIWLIKPPNSYLHVKTHLLVRIDTFENMAGSSVIIVREGLTSAAPLLELYEWPSMKTTVHPFKSYVTSLTTGFYVAFRGVFGPDAQLAIVYTAFSYMDCFPGPEFLCSNHRCIPFYLQCDGFDHCGDSSDEHERCTQNEVDDSDSNLQAHVPNYFFPKTDHYPDLKTAAVVFLASAMSLVMLILLLIVILYRMNHHVREQRELQSQLRTISELLDNTTNGQIDENDENSEQPPAYEHPPDYEVASSNKFDNSSRRSSRAQSNRKRSRSRSRSKSRSIPYDENPILDSPISCTPTPSELLIPEFYLHDEHGLVVTNDIECAVSSRQPSRRPSEAEASQSCRNSQVLLIPESPPPVYTPRKLIVQKMLQSTAYKLEIDQPVNNDFHKSAAPSINLVANTSSSASSGIFLTVPQNTVINDIHYSPVRSATKSVGILDTCQESLVSNIFGSVHEEIYSSPERNIEQNSHVEELNGFVEIPLPIVDDNQTLDTPNIGDFCSFYNRNIHAKIERHRFKNHKQKSLSENGLVYLVMRHKMDLTHEITNIRRSFSDSVLST